MPKPTITLACIVSVDPVTRITSAGVRARSVNAHLRTIVGDGACIVAVVGAVVVTGAVTSAVTNAAVVVANVTVVPAGAFVNICSEKSDEIRKPHTFHSSVYFVYSYFKKGCHSQ